MCPQRIVMCCFYFKYIVVISYLLNCCFGDGYSGLTGPSFVRRMMRFFFFLIFNFLSSPEDIFSLLLEREEGRERNIGVREMHQLVASHMHPEGDCLSRDKIKLQPRYVP